MDSKPEDTEEDDNKDPAVDPTTGQHGKEYYPRTENGKAMAKMFVRFCQILHANARAFGISSLAKLADFQESHWKDTFTQLQKRHPCPNGTERAMVLSPPQQDGI